MPIYGGRPQAEGVENRHAEFGAVMWAYDHRFFSYVNHCHKDAPGTILRSTDPDPSVVPATLTEQIPMSYFTFGLRWANAF